MCPGKGWAGCGGLSEGECPCRSQSYRGSAGGCRHRCGSRKVDNLQGVISSLDFDGIQKQVIDSRRERGQFKILDRRGHPERPCPIVIAGDFFIGLAIGRSEIQNRIVLCPKGAEYQVAWLLDGETEYNLRPITLAACHRGVGIIGSIEAGTGRHTRNRNIPGPFADIITGWASTLDIENKITPVC